MFKFEFNKSNKEEDDNSKFSEAQWYEAHKFEINDELLLKFKECDCKTFEIHDLKLQYVSSADIINKLKETNENSNSIMRAENNHSDLVTAEYEGGLKIWECTSDLISFLYNEKIDFKNKRVLDLGCGAGLLGIYALLNGSLVDFQDYNKEVIEYTTLPNVALNLKDEILKSCKFYYGDWETFTTLIKSKYDYILTSETIYNSNNYTKLCKVFDELLEDNGTIYLAAKTYYFGVGGGIRQFEELLNKNEKFSSTVVWTNLEGVQREIIKIVKNKCLI